MTSRSICVSTVSLFFQRSNMATPQLTLAMCCIWFASPMFASSAACAAPPADDPPTELAVLDALVGSWVFQRDAQDGYSARQECKWILNKQFLEIDTHLARPGHVPSSWRTLIGYDRASNCYRQWKFADSGDVSTAHGTWNEKTSTLRLSGRTPNGNDELSSVKLIDDNAIQVSVTEIVSDEKRAVVMFTLRRVPPQKNTR